MKRCVLQSIAVTAEDSSTHGFTAQLQETRVRLVATSITQATADAETRFLNLKD